jgi:hypothetical protein
LILSSRPPLNPPLEKLCLSGLNFESFYRLLGQRSHDLVNVTAFVRAVSIARVGESASTTQSALRSPRPSSVVVITYACATASPLDFSGADHRGAVRVLDLEPVPRLARPVGRAHPPIVIKRVAMARHRRVTKPAISCRCAVRHAKRHSAMSCGSPGGRCSRSSPAFETCS